MRARLQKYQVVTVRPLTDQQAQTNVFGDAPVLTSKTRSTGSFTISMQVSHTRGILSEPGVPGKDKNKLLVALVLNRDIACSERPDWEPGDDDLVELADGSKMFIHDVQPAFPRRRLSITEPNGGWDGLRLSLQSRDPVQRAAGVYE